jgi:indolepyruvate ferredoxin oxidoreductase
MELAVQIAFKPMQHIDHVLENLSDATHAHALDVARVPETIKGFGHVKARNVAAARSRGSSLMEKWRA